MSDDDYGEARERAADRAAEVERERDELRAALKSLVVRLQGNSMISEKDAHEYDALLDKTGPRCRATYGMHTRCRKAFDHKDEHEGYGFVVYGDPKLERWR